MILASGTDYKYTDRMQMQPIKVLLYGLVFLAVIAVIFSSSSLSDFLMHLFHFGLLFGSSLATRWLVAQTKLTSLPALLLRWDHRLITTLLLFLLFDPGQPWGVFMLLGVLTEVFERLLRAPTGPLLNPAALGGLLLALAGFYPDWWGMSFEPRIVVAGAGASVFTWLFLGAAVWVANKYKKLWLVVGALVSFCLSYGLGFGQLPIGVLLDGTLLFFFLVMLVEPKTSPALKQEQLWFGAAVGSLVVVLLKLAFVEAYLGALLCTELGFQAWRFRQRLAGWLRPNS